MFKKAKAIDSAFQLVRAFCIMVMIICVLLTGFVLQMSYRMVSKAEGRIFILANGKVLEAYAADRKDNIEVEARDHIKVFHHDFFSLDPDEKVITANIIAIFKILLLFFRGIPMLNYLVFFRI